MHFMAADLAEKEEWMVAMQVDATAQHAQRR